MRFVDIELSIRVDDNMNSEEINEMINHFTSLILNQDGVSGVGYSDWSERIIMENEDLAPF